MNLSKKLFSLASILTLAASSMAQGTLGSLGNLGSIFNGGILLPSVQSRYGSYDGSIGNSWLGGSVHAYAGLVRQLQGTYQLGNASAEFSAIARILNHSAEICEIAANATNVMNNGVQQRSGYFRVELLGYAVINNSFANSSTFAQSTSTYNLISAAPATSGPSA
ncbi:MAG: hypothetical protein U1E73_04805 [Planctomycetota bacterium]